MFQNDILNLEYKFERKGRDFGRAFSILGANRVGKTKNRSYKRRGEWIELLFMTLAAARGFKVSKPWGDSSRYDVSLEQDGRFVRVQVKSTGNWVGRCYLCALHAGDRRLYTTLEVDYFAIYVVPDGIWYIFPAKRLLGMTAVALTPHRKGHKYERYKEAWRMLLPVRSRMTGKPLPSETTEIEKKALLRSVSRLKNRIVETNEPGECQPDQ